MCLPPPLHSSHANAVPLDAAAAHPAKEQGIDVVAVNWRGLYTPKGASEASYRKWTEALRKVGASPEWKEAMMANGLAPFNKVGGDFQSYVDGVIGEVRAMSVELGVMK